MVSLCRCNPRKALNSIKTSGQVLLLLGLIIGITAIPVNQAQARPLQAAVPNVSLSAPTAPFIGDAITITANFSNSGADTGYGPYIDLFLPLSGVDGTTGGSNDGISFNNATYLGAPLTTNVLNCPAGTSVSHPLTGLTVACPAQPAGLFSPFVWQMVVITMPFGSFVPSQPDATVTISAQLSNLADLGTPLPIQVRSGFMFGQDPLDNPGVDPVIQSGLTTIAPVPSPNLITLEKTYNGPEDETATGPNYPREYTVTATIASGQTVTNLTLADVLPNNMQYLQMVNPTSGCSVLPSSTTPGGTITCNRGTVTGSTSMTFRYYIPLNDNTGSPVINANSGDDVLSQNTARANGNWQPLDGRDPLTSVIMDPAGYEHILTDKSIAIQKGVTNITGAPNNPGDVLRYTLNFQVSDYFAFDGINITDVLSDGQHLLLGGGYDPQMSINGNQYSLSTVALNASHVDVDCNYSGGPGSECDSDNPAANDGGTTIVFNVSDEITSRSGDAAGRMVGGCVPPTGVGTGNYPNCTSFNDGATTGSITFYTQILEEFTDTYPSGDRSVDQGDVLGNSVTIDGRLLTVQNAITPTGSFEADTSGASVSIPYGVITKSIFAINGSTSFASPVSVSPGDTVTYRVTYTLPTSDFEDLELSDYLPLPVFTAGEVSTFSNTVCGVPGAGTSCLGPSDSYHSLTGAVSPTLSTTAAGNNVTWNYGDYDHVSNPSSMIDLVFTMTVNNQPFADGLYLTNQAHVQENSTNAGSQDANAIVQILLQEPFVTISKGTVWTDKAGAVFSPATVGPVAFNNSCPSFGGTINSINLAANPINSNLAGVDAGDTVRMAVVIENTGRNAAYDVLAHDALPAGMSFVPGSVCVTNGAGAAIPYSGNANDFVTSGITLTSLGRGKMSDGTVVATGSNIAIITYNVTIDATSEALHSYTNTATLTNYAGQPGGPNHIPGGRTDTATVTLAPFSAAKTLVNTNQLFTTGNNVAIGEIVTYRVTISVPEGTTTNVIARDTLPAGMAFVDCLAVNASAGVTSTIGAWANACNDNTNPVITSDGTISTWNLGTITNSNNDAAAELVQLDYSAVVLNAGVRGNTRQNNVSVSYTGNGSTQTAAAAGPIITIVEPTLQVVKTVAPTTGDAGDSVLYTVVISHAAASNTYAFNAHVRDDLSTLPLTLGSLSSVTFTGATCGTPVVTNASTGTVVDLTIDVLPTGCSASFTYAATLTSGASAAQVITNTANIDWSSLPGSVSGQTPYEGTPSLDCERSGNTADCGGATNNYRASDPATVTVPTTPVKSLVSTSEGHTSAAQLAIGEIARYRLQMAWPEGTTINAMFRDNIVNFLQFLNDGTAKVAFVSNSGDCSISPTASITSSTLGTAPWICGNASNISSIVPTFVLPDTAVSSSSTTNNDTYVSGTDAFFKFGDLINSDSDADAEYVVVEFNALVMNNISNQSGQTRGNTFNLLTGSTPAVIGNTSNTITITIVEPVVSITKTLVTAPADAGDPVVYDMVITNTGGANGATAFDLEMTDTLDTNLTTISAVIQTTTQVSPCAGGTVFTATPSVAGQLVTVNATCLDPSQSLTVRISANVIGTAPASLTIPNTARVAWTSLPGLTGTPGASNPTGSTTPGGTGTGTGERNGTGTSGTLNDYNTSASVNAPLANPISVVKNAPVPVVYTIGQTITYPIVVTLHEGTTRNLRVTDTLPQGLAYESMTVDATGFTGSVNAAPAVATAGDPALGSSTTTFTFGDTVVTATTGSGSSSFTLNVTARVLDISQNQIGDIKTNTASAIYLDPDGGGSDVTMPGGSQTITIAEPRIVTTKDVTPATGVDAGDVVTYTVRFTNNGTSTAFDVTALDVLAQGVTYNAGSATCVDQTGTPVGVTISDNTSSLGFDGNPAGSWDIPVNGYVQCTYTATAGSSILLDGTHTNTIDADWTGLDGVDPLERTYNDLVSRTVDGTQDTDDAVFSSPSVTILKTVTPASATIGENLTFTLTINGANGTLRNLVLTDQLPAGLIYNADPVVTGLTGLLAPTVSTPNDGTAMVTITWPAADVTKTADSATIVFTARVADVASNHWATPPMTVPNTFLLDHQTAQGAAQPQQSATATPAIVEPRITTTKSVSPNSNVQAGDTLTYTVTFTNTGTSTAFDVTAHDLLAQGVDYVAASATCVDQASVTVPVSVTDNGTTLDFDGNPAGSWDIAVGNSITCTYQLLADSDLFLDGAHTNTIDADWSSLDGTTANERSYDDSVTRVVDGSQDTDDASFTATGINFSKTVDKATATIGEVVTYTLNITGPNGLIKNLVVADTVESGWIYNNDAAITGLSVTPTLAISSPNDGSAAVNVSWTFGDVEKTTEPATITYSVTIANETTTTTGDTLGNSATLNYNRADDTPATTLTDSTTTDVIEPDLAITKSLVTPPSNSVGSLVSYNLLLGHTASSTADAYDVVVSDTVPPAYLDFTASDNTALTVTFTPAACATYTNNSTPVTDTVNLSIAHLPQGCQASVNFTAVLRLEITPGLLVTNTAYVDYSTLSGLPVEERTYQENNGTSFTTWNPDVDKDLSSSSLADTTDPALTIGEVATFTITVHVPEGTTNTLQVIDDLPLGMAYVDGSAVVDTLTDRTSTAVPAPAISTSGTNGGTVTFDFTGPIVIVDADPLTEDDTFEITLQATLLNDVNNQTGGTLDNQVTVQADGGAILSDSATIAIVEPDLNLAKSVDDATPEPEQEITYTLDLTHTAISTADAYDVVIVDTLPAGLVFVAGSATTPAGWGFSYDGVANTVTFTGNLPLLTATAQFTYRAVVDGATVPVLSTLTNSAEVDWTSLPGTSSEERNGTDGSGGALNDYHDEAQQTVTFYGVELVITKADSPTSIMPSTPTTPSILRYTINYSNTGNLDATNVIITETVPQYTSFNKLTSTGGDTLPPTGWSCADGATAGTSCEFTFATLAAGAAGTLDFDVLIDQTVPANTTQILNTVTIEADEKEPITSNNTDDEDTPLDALPDMAVVKSDGVSVVASGVELTYTLTVRNNGSEGATGVVITDTLPAHVTYVAGSASPAFTRMDTTPPAIPGDPDVVTFTWEISGEWAAGTERTFTYRVLVEDPMPVGVTELVNVAEVEDDGSNGTDPTPADNTSTDTDYLATLPNTNLSKIIASTSEDSTELLNVAIGEALLYRITFVLPPGDLPGMTLSDALPQGLAFGECMSITSSSPLVTTTLVDGFDTTCSTPVITAEPAISLEPVDQGRNVVFDFGDVTNGGTANATLTLDYTVYVLDNAANIRDLELVNLVNWRWGTDNDVQTQSEPVKIVEPTLSIGKVISPTSGIRATVVTYTLTVAHTPESNASAFDVLIEDILPIGMTYLPGTLQVISGPAPDLLEEAGAPVLQIGWDELPARDVDDNPVTVVIQYQAQINEQAGQGSVLVNQARVEWTSLPGDLSAPQTPNNPLSTERYYDPGDAVNIYGAIASAEFSVPKQDVAPETGFAPGVVTDISGKPQVEANELGNLSLDIPAIDVNLPIVGIPANKDGWDLTWLGAKAGWLEGTAYPTWEGNTVITAHVYLPNGKPGPFVDLKKLRWGNRFYILSNGMRYTYEVRIVARVKPDDDTILAHEDRDWVTLVTCAGYDEATGTYKWRDIVKAVLIKVEEE